MAKLSSILRLIEDNVSVQFMADNLINIKDKKRTQDTEITFVTTEVNTQSYSNDEKTALIVWVKPEDYNTAMYSLSTSRDSHDQQAERIKELEEFVQMVAAGDSAEDSMKGILVHTYTHNAKTLLNKG